MEINDFIANFSEQFDDTDPSEINASTEFHKLEEWSSIIGMAVIAMVRTQYNRSITGAEIRSCNTVEELFKLINNK